MITVLVTPRQLAAGEARIEGDRYRHLFRARRVAVGAHLRLVDGRGTARWGTVEAVDKSSARVVLHEGAPSHEAARRVELLVAPLRRDRASWLVEKATELGVAAVRFIAAERSEHAMKPSTFERLARVAEAALEQSHRARLPEISGVHPVEKRTDLLAVAPPTSRWLLDTQPAEVGSATGDAAAPAVLVVGPEGGWRDDERQAFAELGCRPANFGERVLRVETAALAGAALLLCRPLAPPGNGG
ncbi:MAG: RsmE family RNA methyltransferase [Acidobacteriota bacterium]